MKGGKVGRKSEMKIVMKTDRQTDKTDMKIYEQNRNILKNNCIQLLSLSLYNEQFVNVTKMQ